MPLPYRWLTSLMVRYNGSSLLIDCGEGTQIAIKEKGWGFKAIDVICFTHYHGDHVSGLPGLLLTMGNADRTEPLTIVGPKGLERVVGALRVIAPELPFPIRYREITEPEQSFEMNGYRLKAFRVNHNVLCYGYTLEIDRVGRFDVDRANAAGIPQRYWGMLQKGGTWMAVPIRQIWFLDRRGKGLRSLIVRIRDRRILSEIMLREPISLYVRGCTERRTSLRRPKNISI